MATVRNLIIRAMRRIGVVEAVGAALAAEDGAAALDALNEMIDGWVGSAVDCKHRDLFPSGFVLDDTFWMFIPHADATASTIAAMSYQGTWDASANSPALASADGTEGQFYRVSTAGTTTLDDISSWAVDDALIFDGTAWQKARHPRGYEGAIVAMLAARVAPEYGIVPTPQLVADDVRGRSQIMAAYIKPADATYDKAIIATPRRTMTWY